MLLPCHGRAWPHRYQDNAVAENDLVRGLAFPVMARLVRATCFSTSAARGGPDKPGHDGKDNAVLLPTHYPDTYGARPGHDGVATSVGFAVSPETFYAASSLMPSSR